VLALALRALRATPAMLRKRLGTIKHAMAVATTIFVERHVGPPF
jgi:hypothetical protein